MPHLRFAFSCVWAALMVAVASAVTTAAGPSQAPGWSRLMTVSPGDPVVVTLADGRRVERRVVGADWSELVVADLNRVAAGDRRRKMLDLLRTDPVRFAASANIDQEGRRVGVVERLDRASIITVTRPRPCRFQPGVLGWLLAFSGPCPNCDASQTLFGDTVFPSPLGARPDAGELLYAATPLSDGAVPTDLTWAALREWLAQRPGPNLSPAVTHK
jgi:hypothetical protein